MADSDGKTRGRVTVDAQVVEAFETPCRTMDTGHLVELVSTAKTMEALHEMMGRPIEPGSVNYFIAVKGAEAAQELDRRFPAPPLAADEEAPKSWVEIESKVKVGCGRPGCTNCDPTTKGVVH